MNFKTKETKKKLSIGTETFFNNGLLGLIWLAVGILKLIPNVPFSIELFTYIILLIGTAFTFIPVFIKSESSDEMSNYHKIKAQSGTFVYLKGIILLATLYSVIANSNLVDLSLILPFVVSFIYLIYYLKFMHYEKVGD